MKISLNKRVNRSDLTQGQIEACLDKATKIHGADSCSKHGEPGTAFVTKIYPCGSFSLSFDLCCGQYGLDLTSEDEEIYLNEEAKEIEPNWKEYLKEKINTRIRTRE